MFNNQLFAATVETRLRERNIKLRRAAKEVGVSHATIWRLMEGDHSAKLNVVLKVLDWLEVEPSIFFASPDQAEASKQAQIVALVRADTALPPEAQKSLADLIHATYKCFQSEHVESEETHASIR